MINLHKKTPAPGTSNGDTMRSPEDELVLDAEASLDFGVRLLADAVEQSAVLVGLAFRLVTRDDLAVAIAEAGVTADDHPTTGDLELLCLAECHGRAFRV